MAPVKNRNDLDKPGFSPAEEEVGITTNSHQRTDRNLQKIHREVDFRILLWYSFVYLIMRIDVTNISNAAIINIEEGNGIKKELGNLSSEHIYRPFEEMVAFGVDVEDYDYLDPETSDFLSESEKQTVLEGLSSDAPKMKAKTFQWEEVKILLRDPTMITFSLLWITHGIGGWGISFVLPTVIYELGMTNTGIAQLMSMSEFEQSKGLHHQPLLSESQTAARDRSWFGDDYTPIESFVTGMLGDSIEVVGIGTVDLPTKTSPKKTGPSSHGVVRLKNVLHAPRLICNIIRNPILKDYNVLTWFSDTTSGSITRHSDGRTVAYFKPMTGNVMFWEVRLSGPPVGPKVGPSPFNPSDDYMIHAFWPHSERRRFAALQASHQTQTKVSEPLIQNEKAWLKKHHGSEFKFLRDHGLSTYEDEDREEGRAILRALMSDDDDDDDDESEAWSQENLHEF
ncbi:hypothetical protein APSETT445_005156 [Aspergillus pseudonomiae]